MNAPRLRALAAILIIASLSIVFVACGSDGGGDSGADGKNPLDTALHYAPKNAPFVAAVQTDPDGSQIKNGERILEKFPFSGQVKQGITQALRGRKINFDRDVKPVLGNQLIVASTDARSFLDDGSDDDRFVGSFVAKDKDKLQKALDREKPRKEGEVEGQTIYVDDGTRYVLDGDAFVFSDSKRDLVAAVKNSRGDNHFSEDDFDSGTKGLPKESAVRAYFNAEQLINTSPDSAQARKIKWVSALRGAGISANVKGDALDIDFRLGTDSGSLSEEDLPLASGPETAPVIERGGQVGAGFRGIDQVYKFTTDALQAASPNDFNQFEQGKATIEKQLDLDIEKDIVEQLSGDVSTSTAVNGQNASRIELKDPAAFKKTLKKINSVIPGLSRGAKVKRAGGGLYSVDAGNQTIVYGVIDNYFVNANTAAAARSVATAPDTKVDGAKGALAFQADAGQLVQAVVTQFSQAFGNGSSSLGGLQSALGTSLFTGPLGDLKGSVEAEKDAITGKLSLTFD